MAKKNRPLTKKFFIWRGMLENTKAQATAAALGLTLRAFEVRDAEEIDRIFSLRRQSRNQTGNAITAEPMAR